MTRLRLMSFAALVASALVLVAVPAGTAAAADGGSTASASVKKQLKKLKKQVNQLRQQVEDASKQPGPQGAQGPPGPATGPAGGDLTGTYPNPLIGPNAVGSAEIANDAVTSGKIADEAVNGSEIVDGGVTVLDIGPGSVGSSALRPESVGSNALKFVTAVVGPGVTVNAGTPANAEVTCPAGQDLLGAGFAWQDDEANSIISSAPSDANPNGTWVVRGMVAAGSNTLYAWANCLVF